MEPSGPERSAAREIALVYALVALGTAAISYTSSALTRGYGHLLLAVLFLGSALYMARNERGGAAELGIDLSGLLEPKIENGRDPESLGASLRRGVPELFRELGFALVCAAVVFPPFVLLFRLWHDVQHHFAFHPPRPFLDYLLSQLLVIALPEEALFRGYFQHRLNSLFPHRVQLLGATLSPAALVCQAALFALLHFLVGFAPQRLAVFFPALLFGWLKERRQGIGAAVWLHAFCNLLSELLARGYL